MGGRGGRQRPGAGPVAAGRLGQADGLLRRSNLDEGKGDRFLATLDAVVSKAAEVGNVSSWHQPVATLRREAVRDLGQERTKLFRAESLFERAHLLIGDHAERVQGRRRLEAEATFRALGELGREDARRPRSGWDRARPGDPPAEPPRLERRRRRPHRGRPAASEDAGRLVIAWDRERGLRTFEGGVAFRAGQLLPSPSSPPGATR